MDEHFGDFSFLQQEVNQTEKGECESVEEMHDNAINMARTVLVKTAAEGQDFIPVALIYVPFSTPRTVVAMLADGFESRESKRKLGAALATFAAKYKAAAIVLATDGWAVKADPKVTSMEQARRIRPSEHPDRVEVLSVNCIYPDGQCVGVLMEYKRHRVPDSETETIEWQEVNDGRVLGAEYRAEQNIIPAWATGGVS